ncbi:hypothetical protein BV25DRAFT_1820421 [Artomyces pyxidatus]|uniref:Uncharacterized protein n=1 Tax=Artomyces pyxidatus TaxID=48021 RepID=A0ACB8TDG9_9AGAM|nr:hypothetical protein BV25DRAFT_1820421 [Artomyces pyxidatus]
MPLDTPTSPAGLHTPPAMPPSASPLSPSGPDTPRLPSHIPLSISPDPPSGPSVTIHGSPRTPPPYYKTVPTLDPPQHYLRPPRPAVPAGPPLRVRGQHDRSAHPDTVLNNYLQATGQSQALRWQTSQLGPANTPMFSVNVILNDELMGTGHGATRAAARNDAARAALVRLGAMAE